MMISPLKAAKLVWIVFLMTGLLNQEYSYVFFPFNVVDSRITKNLVCSLWDITCFCSKQF